MSIPINRRTALKKVATGAAAIAGTNAVAKHLGDTPATLDLKRNIHHSACRWCYRNVELDELCRRGKLVGLEAIDLVKFDQLPTLKKHGLAASLLDGVPGGIGNGLNRYENHDAIVSFFEDAAPRAQKEGVKRIIVFSGNRNGMDDQTGMGVCKDGLQRIMPIAEKHGIQVVMELLNSKRNHPDYMCDHTHWGVELCEQVGSDNFKLLYDIFHMQIMDGDVIETIKQFYPYFGHYHTGGVPGRHEIDETQELNYPAIMRAILDTGYDGYVAQEFIPTWEDPIAALAHGIRTCDV